MYYDAHNHFHDDWLLPHRAELFPALHKAGILGAVVNGSCEGDWPAVASLCQDQPWLLPSYGVHPWDCGNRSEHWLTTLRRFLEANPLAAVGEIGIDSWMLDRARPDDPRLQGLRRAPLEEQAEVMLAQLQLARELGRPASVHCLDAYGPLLDLLQKSPLPERGFLLHSYAGSAELVAPFVSLGAYFSFNLTFLEPRREKAREAWRRVPEDRILIETDAPAIPPPEDWVRHRLPPAPSGETLNSPLNLVAAYEGLAGLRDMPLLHLQRLCSDNFKRLFLREEQRMRRGTE